jgi:hypothetical protein
MRPSSWAGNPGGREATTTLPSRALNPRPKVPCSPVSLCVCVVSECALIMNTYRRSATHARERERERRRRGREKKGGIWQRGRGRSKHEEYQVRIRSDLEIPMPRNHAGIRSASRPVFAGKEPCRSIGSRHSTNKSRRAHGQVRPQEQSLTICIEYERVENTCDSTS